MKLTKIAIAVLSATLGGFLPGCQGLGAGSSATMAMPSLGLGGVPPQSEPVVADSSDAAPSADGSQN